jgi:hypothetical protein
MVLLCSLKQFYKTILDRSMRLENLFVTVHHVPHDAPDHEFYANEKQTI